MGSCANVEGMALGRSTITLFTVTGRTPRYLCTDFSKLPWSKIAQKLFISSDFIYIYIMYII